ncbi:MAG: hypothetical protein GY795_15865 [Desulfobacterales bacterium]|nr:hypothetical protein [Desulfobacterales bacterium]
MKALKYIPVFFYVFIVYNIFAFSNGNETQSALSYTVAEIKLASGSVMILDTDDFLIILGIIALYSGIRRSTGTSAPSVVDRALSMIVFVLFLIEFTVVKIAGTSSFLILTLMALLEVTAGFYSAISSDSGDLTVIRNSSSQPTHFL